MASWSDPRAPLPCLTFQTSDRVVEPWSGKHAYCPMFDDEPFCEEHAEPLLRQGAAYINSALEEGNTVYVHCESGVSRSSAVVACYLVLFRHLNVAEAAIVLKNSRPQVFPNYALLAALLRIEASEHQLVPSDLSIVKEHFRQRRQVKRSAVNHIVF